MQNKIVKRVTSEKVINGISLLGFSFIGAMLPVRFGSFGGRIISRVKTLPVLQSRGGIFLIRDGIRGLGFNRPGRAWVPISTAGKWRVSMGRGGNSFLGECGGSLTPVQESLLELKDLGLSDLGMFDITADNNHNVKFFFRTLFIILHLMERNT